MPGSLVMRLEPVSAYLGGRRGRRMRESLFASLYLLPATVILATFHFYPVLRAFWISLHRWGLKPGPWVGFNNYINILKDSAFWDSFKATIFYVLGTVPMQLAISLFIVIPGLTLSQHRVARSRVFYG